MKGSHGINNRFFDNGRAHNVKGGQKVAWHGHQSVFGPPAEPIHGAAADQAGKLQRPVAKLFSHLKQNYTIVNAFKDL